MTTNHSTKGSKPCLYNNAGEALNESGFRLQQWFKPDPTTIVTRSERENEDYVIEVEIKEYLNQYKEIEGYTE
jgi:hypothetical protein